MPTQLDVEKYTLQANKEHNQRLNAIYQRGLTGRALDSSIRASEAKRDRAIAKFKASSQDAAPERSNRTCECADSGSMARCGNCDFAPRLRPRLSLTLANEIHDAVEIDNQ